MILIEGTDNSGKSSLVEYIKSRSNIPVVKPFYPKINQLSYYLHSPSNYANFYLERYYISELVYPQFKSNRIQMVSHAQYLIEAGLMPFSPIIIYVRPSNETIKENMLSRGDDYISMEEVDQMIYFYDKTIENSYLPIFKYDYKKMDIQDFLSCVENLHKIRFEISKKFQKYMSSGNIYESGSIMFIGEIPSNLSIGKGYVRAFISDKGSSEFLHKCLYDVEIYPKEQMPYFTNWNKWEGNETLNFKSIQEEIGLLKPRKIICLGKEIRKKLGTGEVLDHPAYIKRFKSNPENYKEYIEKIRELCK